MKNKVVVQDILLNKKGIIGHQVNTYGVMGAGLAAAIREMYPEADYYYQLWCKMGNKPGGVKLGDVLYVDVAPSLFIANMAGQKSFMEKSKIDKLGGQKTPPKKGSYFMMGGYYFSFNEELEDYFMNPLNKDDWRQTDYDALKACLIDVNKFSEKEELELFLPFEIGCGLGGGEWSVVRGLIEENAPRAVLNVLPKDYYKFLQSEDQLQE